MEYGVLESASRSGINVKPFRFDFSITEIENMKTREDFLGRTSGFTRPFGKGVLDSRNIELNYAYVFPVKVLENGLVRDLQNGEKVNLDSLSYSEF